MFKTLQYVIFAAVLVFMAPKIWATYQDRENSKSWPAVTGKLLSGHVKEVRNNTSVTNNHAVRSRHFELTVKYSYEVDGRSYVGYRVRAAGRNYATEAKAAEALVHYQNTERLTVYYDPKKPESSVLEHG
jgi:hypothetical protein